MTFGKPVSPGQTLDQVRLAADANRRATAMETLDALTSPATDDTLLIRDVSVANVFKITLANVLKVMNSLAVEASLDAANDYLLVYDASESAVNRTLIQTLFNLLLATANTFTATQTISSSDAGATAGPLLSLFRDSASPAVNDSIGLITYNGRDSGAAVQPYVDLLGVIDDPTAAAESGHLTIQTTRAGSRAPRAVVGAGLYTAGATDNGADTISALSIYYGTRRIRSGAGTPEGAVVGNVGDLYTRTDGGAGTTLYVKESGTGNTGWAAK